MTPGAVRNVNQASLCPHADTKDVRDVPESLKRRVCAEYGVKRCDGSLEIDHLISLELGGSNDIRNLWPEPYSPKPGAHEKDKLENFLHHQVCSGEMGLGEAQESIGGDWYSSYLEMERASGKLLHTAKASVH